MDAFSDPQYKTPEGAALRIWRDAAPNKFQSEQLGRAIFDEVIFCEVITPGSRDSTPVFELERTFCDEAGIATPRRGPKYDEFKTFVLDFKRDEEIDGSLTGTPLSQWAEMNRSMVAALKAQGIYTVDALATVPDTKLSIVGPDGRQWRDKADAYIKTAKDAGYATELAAKLSNMETTLAASADREKALAQRVQELEAAAARGAPAPKPGKAAQAAPPTPTEGAPPTPVAAEGETLVAAGDTKSTADVPII